MIPLAERVLLQLWWTDATNVAGGWHDAEDLARFATNGAWEASNTGWLVHEDDLCYVLAGRMTDDGANVGLIERIPKAAVTRKAVLRGQCGPDAGSPAVTPAAPDDGPLPMSWATSTSTLPGTITVNAAGSVTTERGLIEAVRVGLMKSAAANWRTA